MEAYILLFLHLTFKFLPTVSDTFLAGGRFFQVTLVRIPGTLFKLIKMVNSRTHKLTIELDPQSLFGLLITAVLFG